MTFFIETVLPVLVLILGFAFLVKGADWFVDGSSGIAEKLGVSKIFIALTIVAMGTSVPELAVSLLAAIQKNADLSVGNIVGTNILNILLILGVTAMIVPLCIQKTTLCFEIPIMILTAGIFAFLGFGSSVFKFSSFQNGILSRCDGIILLLLFSLYVFYLSRIAKQRSSKNAIVVYSMPVSWMQLIMILLIGLMLIIAGSSFIVDAASDIAKKLGVSDRIIGLTIVAFGTSLPELAASIMAAVKNQPVLAVGNIVGSNIFNMLFIGGITALISPVTFNASFRLDSIICTGVSLFLLLLILLDKQKRLTRISGVLMVILYSAYFVRLVIK